MPLCSGWVSGAAMERLVSNSMTLEVLQFDHTRLGPSGKHYLAALLANLSSLRTLWTPDWEAVTQEAVNQIARLSSLQDLKLDSHQVSRLALSSAYSQYYQTRHLKRLPARTSHNAVDCPAARHVLDIAC